MKQRLLTLLLVLAIALLALAACGGGGGTNDNTATTPGALDGEQPLSTEVVGTPEDLGGDDATTPEP